MTLNDIEILKSGQTRQAIRDNLDTDPARIALNKQIQNAALVASQVKYLQRARTKLPSYFEAECIIPALSFEQSSSEECAQHKRYSGKLCIDLTCGLGVDSLYLSKQFDQVISIEIDPILAEIARINFARLGTTNISVVNSSAEQFLYSFDSHSDLIYTDPDRRANDNHKLILLQDCSPNIIDLLTIIKSKSDRIVIKTSPLFDVDEPFRIFGNHTQVEVVSLAGECKEVLIELDDKISKPTIRTTALNIGSEIFELEKPHITQIGKILESEYKYLIIPDVSLQKARRAVEYLSRHNNIYIETDNGYGLSNTLNSNLLARTYQIESIEPYNPKRLKQQLKESGTTNLDILKKEFPEQSAEIAKKLGVKQGGTTKIAFTMLQNQRFAIRIK